MKMCTAKSSHRQETGSGVQIYIVDDDKIARETIGAMLVVSRHRISKYSDAEEFLAAMGPEDRGCLLADVRMPGMGGIQLIERLARVRAPFAMLVISGHADVPLAVQAIKAGALDIIEKPFTKTVLLDQIRKAIVAFEQDQSRQPTQSPAHKSPGLSVRERQVLKLTIAGHSSKEIARQLGGSPRTIETHRANIMKKMGVKRLSALIHLSASGERRNDCI